MIKKIIAVLLVAICLTGCTSEIKEEDGAKWAQEHGYVLASDYNITLDELTSATQTGEGGLNFGDVEWTDSLKKETIKEYLKGDVSTLYADGYNHRNMMQIAAAWNNQPVIGSVEFSMNDDFTFTAGSEKNTEKLNAMLQNPQVSLYWTKQLRESDGMPSYFYAYGVEVQGKVEFYDWANLSGDALTKALGDIRNYFKTMGAMYGTYFDSTNANYLSDSALKDKMLASGTTYYKVVPNKIVITSPYMLFMSKMTGTYQVINTATNAWVDYPLVSETLLDAMLAVVQTQYPNTLFLNASQLYPVLAQMIPGFAQTGGLKTQATLEF